MKILVINCGSSSLKYQLIDMENEEVLAKGNYERIGQKNSFLTHKVNGEKYLIEEPVENHKQAFEIILDQLLNKEYKVINSLVEIGAIGHRVPDGLDIFDKSVIIDDEVMNLIASCKELAPIHIPATINGIKACQNLMPGKKNVAVFDTAFHHTIPEERYIYPIPYKYYEKYKMRKYGFHGTSHRYVSKRVAQLMDKPIEELKTIVCHLGQGASLCAVDGGISVDTSMGMTPVSGIMMCARAGDLDPSIVTFLIKKEGLTPDQVEQVLNQESGVYGISGVSKDFRDITAAVKEGNKRALLSRKAYAYNVAQYVAKYGVSMHGINTIVFTAGIGENQPSIRKEICEYLDWLGVDIDDALNEKAVGVEQKISSESSKVEVWVIPTNEELVIARDTLELVKQEI